MNRRVAPYVFLLPFAIIFVMFLLYPLGRSMVLSLYKTAGPRHMRFVGAGNYRFLLTDLLFWRAVLNTAIFTVGFLVIQIPASLGLALLLNSRLVRWRGLWRFAFFSPYLVGQVFVGVIFFIMLTPLQFTERPALAMLTVILASLWLMIGYGMIYFLAALQGIDPQLYEAAEIDGAGGWARFRHVTLPGIRGVLVFLVLAGTIASFQLFELPYVLFQGPGPNWSALTIVMYLYQIGFEAGDMGYASAIGWALVVVILIVAWLQLRLTGTLREGAT